MQICSTSVGCEDATFPQAAWQLRFASYLQIQTGHKDLKLHGSFVSPHTCRLKPVTKTTVDSRLPSPESAHPTKNLSILLSVHSMQARARTTCQTNGMAVDSP